MTEMMTGCEGPETPAEGCAPRQILPGSLQPHNPAVREGAGGPNIDQEMQWLPAREDYPLRAPSVNAQLLLSPPQGLGADPLRSCPSEVVPGESCEETCRDPAELLFKDDSGSHPSEALCKGQGGEMPCEEACETVCKVLARENHEDLCEESWPGKRRLPSIVVEPSEGDDVESGELRWPPEDFSLLEEAEEDELFAESEEVLGTELPSFESDLEEVLL